MGRFIDIIQEQFPNNTLTKNEKGMIVVDGIETPFGWLTDEEVNKMDHTFIPAKDDTPMYSGTISDLHGVDFLNDIALANADNMKYFLSLSKKEVQ